MHATLFVALVLGQPGPLAFEVDVPGEIALAAPPESVNWEMAHTVSLPFAGSAEELWALAGLSEGEPFLSAAQASRLGPWGDGGAWIAFVLGMESSASCRLERVGIAEDVDPGPAAFRFEEIASVTDVGETPTRIEERKVYLSDGGVPVLEYVTAPRGAQNVPMRYARADYIEPLLSPSGVWLTEDFPEDHLHQGGLFWRWATVTWEGGGGGPWEMEGLYSRVEETLGMETGPVCAVVGFRCGWYTGRAATDPDGERVAQQDVWIRVWRATGAGRRIDVSLSLRACVPGLRIEGREDQGKGYGGFSLRMAESADRRFVTSEGPIEGDALGTRAEWVDCSQTDREGREAGITMWADPTHPAGSPADWFLRQYGMWCLRWPGLASVEIPSDRDLTLEHHLWVHDGDAAQGSAPLAYASWQWTSGARIRPAE